MARTRDEKKAEEKRRQILAAAKRCFVAGGFHQTSVQQICKEAKMSPGGVYRYFASKDEMVLGIALEEQQELLELEEFLVTKGKQLPRILSASKAVAKDLAQPEAQRLGVELLSEAGRNSQVRQAFLANQQRAVAAFAQAIQRAQEKGEISAREKPERLAALLWGLLENFGSYLLLDENYRPLKDWALVERMILGLLDPA